MRLILCCVLASVLVPSVGRAQSTEGVPVFKVTPVESSIKFDVEASVAIKGTFDKWDASLIFKSPDVSTGVLDISRYRKRDEKQQIEGQGFLQCETKP